MITEDYVSFEVAKLLKEKGFDEVCRAWYFGEDRIDNNILTPKDKLLLVSDNYYGAKKNSSIGYPNAVTAPTLQMARKWLREEHNIEITIHPFSQDKHCKTTGYDFSYWYHRECFIPYLEPNHILYGKTWERYEEAANAALLYIIKELI